MEIKDSNWDKIKEDLQKAVKLEENKDDLSIKIIILESNIKENQMVGGMLRGGEEMKQSLRQFLGKSEPLDCDISINQEERTILMKFNNNEDFYKVYELLNDMFFGDFFKKMIDALRGAFGATFGHDDFKF